MSRTLHDSFAKDWMREFLNDFGTVETEYPISGEVRHIDVYFEPDRAALPAPMGLLGRMIEAPCLIEPFRNAVPINEIGNCKTKSVILGHNLVRQAKKAKRQFRYTDRPFLWIISPTLSPAIAQGFGGHQTRHWGAGIYFLPRHERTALIAIHQLPVTLDTLWLRLLGRDTVQKNAINELMALPASHPYRSSTLKHITVLQKTLTARHNLTKDLQVVIMNLAITYEQIEAEIIEKGMAKGIEQGIEQTKQTIARNMLQEGMEPAIVARLIGLTINQLPVL
jgi:hypothetical protein